MQKISRAGSAPCFQLTEAVCFDQQGINCLLLGNDLEEATADMAIYLKCLLQQEACSSLSPPGAALPIISHSHHVGFTAVVVSYNRLQPNALLSTVL